MELFNNCRLCRANCSEIDCYSISSTIDGVDIQEILTHTVPVVISDEDHYSMPRIICIECFQTTSRAYELQKVAIESDQYYREQNPFKIKTEDFVEVKLECPEYEYQPEYEEPGGSFQITVFEDAKPKKRQETSFVPRIAKGSESMPFDDSYFECNFCERKIKPRRNMAYHLKLHDPKIYPLRCPKCIRRFDSEKKLESHIQSGCEGSEERPVYECDQCGATTSSKIGMENHLIDDHIKLQLKQAKRRKNARKAEDRNANKPTNCGACNQEFPNKKEFTLHFMTVHEVIIRELQPEEVNVNLSCCMCEEVQSSVKSLLKHSTTHLEGFEAFKCKICLKKLKTSTEFIKHSEYHTQPPTHKCLRCELNFCYDDNFLIHLRKHKSDDNFKIECKKCGRKLASMKEFLNHDRIKHRQETLFICPICAKSSTTSSGLDQHIKFVHNKEQEAKFHCRFCPMKFVVKNKLFRHEATHSTERPHVCEICSSAFKHIDGLRKHMKRHNGTLSMNHVCSQCGYKCNSKNMLEGHMLSHTGLKPHECRFCDRAYALKGDLTKHMRKVHVGDAIYQCEKCPRAFRLVVELREHQRDHLA